jgi:hypothetical protein
VPFTLSFFLNGCFEADMDNRLPPPSCSQLPAPNLLSPSRVFSSHDFSPPSRYYYEGGTLGSERCVLLCPT